MMRTELTEKIEYLTCRASELIAGESIEELNQVLLQRQNLIEQLWNSANQSATTSEIKDFLLSIQARDAEQLSQLSLLKQTLKQQEQARKLANAKVSKYIAINKLR
ncbi:hypothetical protein [Motilimonas sp. 1_MG-2023]|uniref:hypothetical protein n=1 Tax=Motilimonas TaxID=1914248 RepID=UPI0026E4333B|nr:hypothetical protein [Motilimonas sp. 1_MG-2023]MDO6524957.1 hypothetical protein [Motilimonas sp. 1_MG-2023]